MDVCLYRSLLVAGLDALGNHRLILFDQAFNVNQRLPQNEWPPSFEERGAMQF